MKKFTTLLLALLLVIPAMAATLKSGEIFYLDAGGSSLWDQGDAKFSVYFWNSSGNAWTEFGVKNAETGYYEFTVPGTNQSYTQCIILRKNSTATNSKDWNNEWNRKGDLTISGNLYTVTGWGNTDGKWSTYTPVVAGEPVIALDYSPSTVYINEEVTISAAVTENAPASYTLSVQVSDASNNNTPITITNGTGTWTPTVAGEYTISAVCMVGSETKATKTATVIVREHALYIRGSIDAFGAWGNGTKMTFDAGSYTWTGDITADAQFKFTEDVSSWDVQYTLDNETVNGGQNYTLATGADNIIWGGGDANVTITVSDVTSSSANMYITVNSSTDPVDPVAPEVLSIRGDDMGWDSGELMTLDGTTYTWTGTLTNGNGFKFVAAESGWEASEFTTQSDVVADTQYSLGSGYNNCIWKGETGEVTITVDFTNSATAPTLTIVVNSVNELVVPDALYITSSMDEWATFNAMEKNENVFTWTGDLASAAEFKFTTVDNWEGGKYVYEGTVNVDSEGYTLVDGDGKGNTVWGGATANVTINVDFSGEAPLMKIVYNSGEATIHSKDYFYLIPGMWDVDGAWYAARFHNAFTNDEVWVKGSMVSGEGEGEYAGQTITYYEFIVPMPEVTVYSDEEVLAEYTHVIFTRMNPASEDMTWDNKWNQTSNLYISEDLPTNIYEVPASVADGESWDYVGAWKEENVFPTGIEDVEVANGIVYTYGVVTAEGAIEVYNMSGAVVARGNDNVDLRGLNGGVYIVRCGDNVRKVVR